MSEQPPTPEPAEEAGSAQESERETQAEDPTSPLRGFEDPEDAEEQPGHAEHD
jgi:hypothetical protein